MQAAGSWPGPVFKQHNSAATKDCAGALSQRGFPGSRRLRVGAWKTLHFFAALQASASEDGLAQHCCISHSAWADINTPLQRLARTIGEHKHNTTCPVHTSSQRRQRHARSWTSTCRESAPQNQSARFYSSTRIEKRLTTLA